MISRFTATALALAAGVSATSSPPQPTPARSPLLPSSPSPTSPPVPNPPPQIYNVGSASPTTLAFTCPSAGSYSCVAALCPQGTNAPVAVTISPDYFGWNFYPPYDASSFPPQTTLASDARVQGRVALRHHWHQDQGQPGLHGQCDEHSARAGDSRRDGRYALLRGRRGGAGERHDGRCFSDWQRRYFVHNTLSVGSFKSSMPAKPMTASSVTRDPTSVLYWRVTVTGVAAGVTLEPSKGAAGSVGVALPAAFYCWACGLHSGFLNAPESGGGRRGWDGRGVSCD
ncbi:hypothetical protein B0J12DRAFT_698510 [Macrophomina phaseolina]|uniref:Uncharacterized protein n=1 Tax=Macrophomina phaseolina TaxID=35725 RepID=A0ABQ8GED8_9PEZI|nr:hypothetical protein B0J12DRAFT_698510 [Macrophomina phaseolina]